MFDEIEACVFDAYGTLFDVHSAAARLRGELGDNADALSAIWRERQLRYTWLRSLMGQHDSFWQITGDALDYAMRRLDMEDPGLRARLMELYLRLEAYPDARDALDRLKAGGQKTAILSNGDMSMLIAAAKNADVYSMFGRILSVESAATYKPHPSAYRLAADQLKVPPERIAFLSSNGWDVHGAGAFGFAAIWINRTGEPPERLPAPPRAEIETLAELPEILGI